MTNKFGLAILVIGLSGCSHLSNLGCDLENQVIKASAQVVVKELECSNTDAVEKDLRTLLRTKVQVCSESPQPVSVNSWVCRKAGETAIEQVAKKIPATWNCKATKIKDTLKSLVEKACSDTQS